MAIEATVVHNGLIWVEVTQGDLAKLLQVLLAGIETVEMSTQSGPEEWRVLKALMVEQGGEDETLDSQQQGRLMLLRSQPSALTELASALSELASERTKYQPGMRQLRLTGYDKRLSTQSRSVVFELT
jgi:hypothetical protein